MNAITRSLVALRSAVVVGVRAVTQPAVLGVAALCMDAQGRVLLVRHRLGGFWAFPGGGVDRGEAPAAAAMRELAEEAGHSGGGPPVLFGLYRQSKLWVTNYIVLYRVAGGQIAFEPNWETTDARWFDPEALPTNMAPAVRRRLAEAGGLVPQSPDW